VIELGAVVIDHADDLRSPDHRFPLAVDAEEFICISYWMYKLLDEHSRTTAGLRSNIEQVKKKSSQA
jgi:hypothetical protein